MQKLKILTAVILLSWFLYFGNQGSVSAAADLKMPPAVVFVQDTNNKMLLKHNFSFDDGLLKNYDMNVDEGFYVQVKF